MTQNIKDFILKFKNDKGCPKNILEVGSLDINGNVRNIFGCAYTGIDLQEGKNVEIVMDAVDIKDKFQAESFDCVLCLETLEHAKDPLSIVKNMKWVLQKKGWLVITTPGIAFGQHNYPSDYYRFFESTYRDIFFDGFINCTIKATPVAIYGYAQKP